MIRFILKKHLCNLECTHLPEVFVYEIFLFFFPACFWTYFSALQSLGFHLLLWEASQSATACCPPSPLTSSWPCCVSPPSAPVGQCWLGGGHRSQDFLLFCSLFLPPVLMPASPLVCSFHSVAFFVFFFFPNPCLSRVTAVLQSLIPPDTSMIAPAQHWCNKKELSH